MKDSENCCFRVNIVQVKKSAFRNTDIDRERYLCSLN